jgi:hypothetical protein
VAYIVGVVLGLLTCGLFRLAGFDRDRALYPAALLAIASYYVLFAAIGGSTSALIAESVQFAVFFGLAFVGFRFSPWVLVAGLAAHGIYDFVHPHLVNNPGVPPWWPPFCLACDLVMALVVALLIQRRIIPAGPHPVEP